MKEDEENEALMLSIEDGTLTEYKPDDYVEMRKDELELIKGFIEKYKDLFNEYISENKKENGNTKSKKQITMQRH